MAEPRLFDLNIKKILEAWDNSHAVRELIANALDEQTLSGTAPVEIAKDSSGVWCVRDYGRGLRYEHFTQNENPEKLQAVGRVIGKFGVGLKDAMATLDRNGVTVEIESKHGVITLTQVAKHGFGEIVTLHAAVLPPRDPDFVGTRVQLPGLSDADMAQAKAFFLLFSGEALLEETKIGAILRKVGAASRIYVAGLLVAEEENFAFSYNITSLTEAMKKALNRERTNVGRTAYAERVKAMLLQTRSAEVATILAEQLRLLERGTASDEVNWKDVTVHACKILNGSGRFLFVTSYQLLSNADAVDHARGDGLQVVTVPDTILEAIRGSEDLTGTPIRDLGVYQSEWNDSFTFDWVAPEAMAPAERAVFTEKDRIAALVGGLPKHVRAVRVSKTMRVDFSAGGDAVGLWDPASASIVIRRDQLRSLADFAGILLHEIAHARSGFGDVSRPFENELTDYLGLTAAAALPSASPDPTSGRKRGFWRR
jgi:hypothetical protein